MTFEPEMDAKSLRKYELPDLLHAVLLQLYPDFIAMAPGWLPIFNASGPAVQTLRVQGFALPKASGSHIPLNSIEASVHGIKPIVCG